MLQATQVRDVRPNVASRDDRSSGVSVGDADLHSQVRGAVVHALALYDERRRPERVEDLCQEVWCRLLERRALSRFRGGGDLVRRRYLRRIAVNVLIDEIRSKGARKRQPGKIVSIEAARLEVARRADLSECPERRLLAREELRSLAALCRIHCGTGRNRERWRVARLGLIEGFSSSEIARGLGGRWTVVAIDSYLCRLRRRLRNAGLVLPCRPRGRSPR